MRILYIVPYAPNRIRVRPYNLILQLSERGHKVTVATVWTNEAEREDLERLRPHVHRLWSMPLPPRRSLWNCLRALPTTWPLQAVYSWHPELASKLKGLVANGVGDRKYDLVHVEHLRGARYGFSIRDQNQTDVPIVWDSVDCISHLFEQSALRSSRRFSRWISRLELARTSHLEAKAVETFTRTIVTSAKDSDALAGQSEVGKSSISVIPNGVDLEYFRPSSKGMVEPATIVLSGKMSYHANVAMVDYFVENILPGLKESHPEVKVWIVGKDPPARIRKLDQDPRIMVTGMVPDMRPYLQKATVAAVPLTYGAGIQNKVLEAMACATPVVASSIAAGSLSAERGRALLVPDTPGEWIRAISELIEDPQRRRQVGQAGRAYVEQHHKWSEIAADLEEIYLGINSH